METKANFVLIGAVTVLGLLGLLGLLVWFAKVEIDRQYAQYEVLFDSVSGLGMAADVRYNGLSVGKVTGLALDAEDPGKVRVRIEVAAGTPVKTDTVAQLNSQGVTGVAFVALTGGSPDAPLLRDPADPAAVPLVRSERSVVQALTEDAPDLIEEAVAAIKEVRTFLGPENQAAVSNMLRNLDAASQRLEVALSDFSDISRTVSEGTAEISRFTGRLDEIGADIQTTLAKVNETLDTATAAIAGVQPTLDSASAAFAGAETVFGDVDAIVKDRVPQVVDDLAAAIRTVEAATEDMRAQLGTVLGKLGGSADAAGQRLAEIEATIAALDTTLAEARASFGAVESASASFQGLVDGDGTAMVADARETLAMARESIGRIDALFREDIPAIVADVRAATGAAREVIDAAGADVKAFTDGLDPLLTAGRETLQAATETLANANRTLANLDRALATTETTLDAAGRAFDSADAIMSSDLGPAAADVRAAAGQFGTAMAALSEDIPGVAAELRDAMARAREVIDKVDAAVTASTRPVQSFAREGLPAFTGFAREAQQLVGRLDQVARKMERDPARFFFGNNLPEFRR